MNFEIAPKSTEIQADWYEARMYCFSLNIDGKVGWRLPTIDEINEIYQSTNDFVLHGYWSSTEVDLSPDGHYLNALCRIFDDQGLQGRIWKTNNTGFVRAIRDLA